MNKIIKIQEKDDYVLIEFSKSNEDVIKNNNKKQKNKKKKRKWFKF